MDHTFLIAALKKIGFGPYFIDWIKVLLNGNESCVINGGTTSKYFKLLRGARQGDPIAAYLFIITLEVYFIMLRSNREIKQLNIFNDSFLLSAYADDTTFFVQDLASITLILDIFGVFSIFSGFKLNTSKCEVCGIGVLKGVNTALCNVKNINLTTNFIKILGFHFSYNKELSINKNFISAIQKIENTLKIWKMRKLTLIGKIVIFKTLAISQIVYITSISSLPSCILNTLNTIQKDFIWDGKRAKIKHSTLISNYSEGGLCDIDIELKIKSLQLSWLKRFYDTNHHPWKTIPKYIFSKVSASNSIFFPNFALGISKSLANIPVFYQDILKFWSEVSSSTPLTASSILSECMWNNNLLRIDHNIISPSTFDNKINMLFVADFFDPKGNLLPWNCFKILHSIENKHYFNWIKMVNVLPRQWKETIKCDEGKSLIFCEFVPHLIVNAKLFPMNKLTSKELYNIFIKTKVKPPTSQNTFLSLFGVNSLPWKKIYTLPNLISIDSYSRMFQYKCLNNILYLNKILHRIGFADSPLCSYCKQDNETVQHLFIECRVSKSLWNDIILFFNDKLDIPNLDLQSAILGFIDSRKDSLALNNILLIFKLCLYRFRDKKAPTFLSFLKNLREREFLERKIVFLNQNKLDFHNKKWEFLTTSV